MASLQQVFQGGFDANAVEPDQGRGDFTLIEAGTLLDFEITGAEVKDAGTGSGCYLVLESTAIGPTHVGRKIWKNITLRNTNAQAESIGQAQLSALCRAVNIPKLNDTDQLFGKIFRGRVGVEKGRAKDKNNPNGERWPDKNDIAAFEAVGAQQPGPSAQRPAANTPAPATGAKAAPPWAKR
jgi:hypothetical protein